MVYRARKIQRFLSQPFSVAQVFTGSEGKQVPVADTVRGFKEILEGKHDDVPESNFYMKGGIDDVLQQWPPAEGQQLLGPAHAPRRAGREDDSGHAHLRHTHFRHRRAGRGGGPRHG